MAQMFLVHWPPLKSNPRFSKTSPFHGRLVEVIGSIFRAKIFRFAASTNLNGSRVANSNIRRVIEESGSVFGKKHRKDSFTMFPYFLKKHLPLTGGFLPIFAFVFSPPRK